MNSAMIIARPAGFRRPVDSSASVEMPSKPRKLSTAIDSAAAISGALTRRRSSRSASVLQPTSGSVPPLIARDRDDDEDHDEDELDGEEDPVGDLDRADAEQVDHGVDRRRTRGPRASAACRGTARPSTRRRTRRAASARAGSRAGSPSRRRSPTDRGGCRGRRRRRRTRRAGTTSPSARRRAR